MPHQWTKVISQLVRTARGTSAICAIHGPPSFVPPASDKINCMVRMAYPAGVVDPCCKRVDSLDLEADVLAIFTRGTAEEYFAELV